MPTTNIAHSGGFVNTFLMILFKDLHTITAYQLTIVFVVSYC